MSIHVLYHANCYDGFGSAYAAWKLFDDGAHYHPMYYNQPLPEFLPGDVVLMVDYSRKAAEILELLENGIRVEIYDHHQTAEAELKKIPGHWAKEQLNIWFDMNRSGAVITWQGLGLGEVPPLLKHIQDRDLWRFELEGTKEIHAALCAYPFDFEIWDSFDVERLKEEGALILRYHQLLTDRLCEQVNMVWIGGHEVPCVNTCLLFSEVPQKLLELYPDAPFAAFHYARKDGVIQFGLRGRGDFDVSKVAQQYGGGGHYSAAGFEIKTKLEIGG